MTPEQNSTSSDSVRCFLALLPDNASRDVLRQCRDRLEDALAGAARGVRWVDAASLHMTLRFLGETDNAQAEYMKHMLPALAIRLPALPAGRFAIWPNRARPRMLVLELEAREALCALARECEALACKTGFEPEPRAFRAHLTLARLRPGFAFGGLPPPLCSLAFGTLALMASDLRTMGARYRALASAALGDAQNP